MALRFRAQTEHPARKRRTFLSREEIVAAAATVLERDGYDALNMRSVAALLDVQAAALYRYVKSREELDDLLFDHLMEGCAPAVPGSDWREDLRKIANAWRTRLLERRDATRIAFLDVSIGPNVIPLMEACLNALRRSGMDDDDVVDAYDTFIFFVHSVASAEASYRGRPAGCRAKEHSYQLPKPDWAKAYPTVTALLNRLTVPPDFDAQFAFGFDALIAGVERRAEARALSRRSSPRRTPVRGRPGTSRKGA